MISNVLLVYVPSRQGVRLGELPLGLLYVGSVLERLGINIEIFDLYLYNSSRENRYGYFKLKKVIDSFDPDIVGFGGIATSYTWTKNLSNRIKKECPEIIQIAGGALSSVYDLLLTKAMIDIVFHGEIESNLPIFIDRLDNKKPWFDIQGISYLNNNEIKRNPPVPQIKNLDHIPFPAYHLVEVKKYFVKKQRLLEHYKEDMVNQRLYEDVVRKLDGVDNFLPMVTSRGCTNRCSFCFRHMKGYRTHSVDYVIRHIKYVKENFGVNGISFFDESFNGDMKWVFNLCDEIERNSMKIAYRAAARADKVSEKMLRRMYETGCFSLNYGQESGSEKILKEYRKGVTRKQNIETTLLTRKVGIYSTVQLVIGSPGETRDTIEETIDFLREVGVRYYSINYLIPLPEAPVWQYVIEKNLISDIDDYLEQVAIKGGGPVINLTQVPDKEWRSWSNLIDYNMNLHYRKSAGNYRDCLKLCAKYHLKRILPEQIKKQLRILLKKGK